MDVRDIRLRCAICGEPLEFVEIACDREHDEHHHAHCKACSPAGWFACVSISVGVHEEHGS